MRQDMIQPHHYDDVPEARLTSCCGVCIGRQLIPAVVVVTSVSDTENKWNILGKQTLKTLIMTTAHQHRTEPPSDLIQLPLLLLTLVNRAELTKGGKEECVTWPLTTAVTTGHSITTWSPVSTTPQWFAPSSPDGNRRMMIMVITQNS